MATYLQIVGGVAVDASEASSAWVAAQSATWIEATGGARIGWSWDGSAWSAPPAPTNAERAAGITLERMTFEAALAAAMGLSWSSLIPTVTGIINASTNLSAAERDVAVGIIGGAANAFLRGDQRVLIADPLTTAKDLLERCAAELGFGAPAGGWTTEPWADRVTAASAALDLLFIAAAEG